MPKVLYIPAPVNEPMRVMELNGLDAYKQVIGCDMAQAVYPVDPYWDSQNVVAYMDEEAMMIEPPPPENDRIEHLFDHWNFGIGLRGGAIIVGGGDHGNDTDIPESLVGWARQRHAVFEVNA